MSTQSWGTTRICMRETLTELLTVGYFCTEPKFILELYWILIVLVSGYLTLTPTHLGMPENTQVDARHKTTG